VLLAAGACLALCGCGANSTANLDDFVTTMAKTNCHVTISTAAQVGMMSPGSGVQFQAQADCPNNGASTTQVTTVSKAAPANELTAP
jgi:hypothetical protein